MLSYQELLIQQIIDIKKKKPKNMEWTAKSFYWLNNHFSNRKEYTEYKNNLNGHGKNRFNANKM